jgi:hypothetical protein
MLLNCEQANVPGQLLSLLLLSEDIHVASCNTPDEQGRLHNKYDTCPTCFALQTWRCSHEAGDLLCCATARSDQAV